MLEPTAIETRTRPESRAQRAQQDARLFRRYRCDPTPELREALVERYLPLVRHLAARYARSGEYDDLVQVGSFALLKAIDRFDPERGLAFSSFAVPTIAGELKRYFRDHGWALRVPRDLQERALLIDRTSERLTRSLGRAPTPAELATELDISVELVLEALQTVTAHRPDRLDAPADADDENSERPRTTVASEESGYATAEASATLEPLLARLDERERLVLRLRFESDLLQTEIADIIGVSQMQVSRIQRRALEQLQAFADDGRQAPPSPSR
jgi:RNA polymerase sigma-B factor